MHKEQITRFLRINLALSNILDRFMDFFKYTKQRLENPLKCVLPGNLPHLPRRFWIYYKKNHMAKSPLGGDTFSLVY